MDKERAKFYQSGDGSYFYSADDASKWDLLDRIGQLNLLHVLKKEWEPEESSQSKLRKVLQEINIDEFEDFMASQFILLLEIIQRIIKILMMLML